MQCPKKNATAVFEARWSKRIESVRKDVGCTFGILKSRFRILKVPMQYWAKEDRDNIMFTCCVLHNILLDHELLDQRNIMSTPQTHWHLKPCSNVNWVLIR